MRVLITGSTGRLGGAFLSLWNNCDGYDVRGLTREDADLSQPGQVDALLRATAFDVLVNTAAVSGLEECLDAPGLAHAVNAESPRVMAAICREKGARLVHFSTDYVFSGEDAGSKTETDATGAVNVYGASKCAGEQAVLAADDQSLVCRVSWLFGPAPPDRPSHFDNVLRRALAGEEQHLVDDKFSVPTFTHDIVRWVGLLLEREKSGIYHLCNSGGPESWHSYAVKICRLARRHGLEVDSSKLVSTSLNDARFFREKRPVHTAMLPARLEHEGIVSPRPWLDAAEEYLKSR
ncbi:MAG: NAD(P)-dependent oxidoreductase [Akkermansiaceae bacterium]|nr:NAD(P)-dependent oxidoreductase [Akkermansiaceae bacterium]